MNRVLLKQPRQRLDLELYDRLREQVLYQMAGDANFAGPTQIWWFAAKNFEAKVATTQRKT